MIRAKSIIFGAVGVALAAISIVPAAAEKRVALVIGNAAYRHVGNLANPASDTEAVAVLLRAARFDVTVRADVDVAGLRRALGDFADLASDAEIAVVYYAGHGIEVDGANYLIPVDARLARDFDIDDETVSLDRVLKAIEPARCLRLVILDACRDNPFLKTMRRSTAGRSIGRGLGRVEPTVSDTLVAFAARPGAIALDGEPGRNSPFAAALVKHLAEPGLDIRLAFGRVRDDVLESTNRRQEPFVSGSMGGRTVPLIEAPSPAPQVRPNIDPDAAVRRDYEIAERAGTKEAWDLFLVRHPAGYYAELARVQRGKLAVVVPPLPPADVTPLSPGRERRLKVKDTFKECDACPEMVVVPAGSFTMGSPESEEERSSDEGPQRQVTFATPFAVGRFAVTFEEWDACVADGGCNGHSPADQDWGRGKLPVIDVSWNDAQAYVAWLSRKTGRTYRLLSEAEREYVTRAGTTTPFWWSSSISPNQANYDGNYTYAGGQEGEYRQKTVPVDSFAPNPWGLYQVHGNVWEWVEDCYNDTYTNAPADGSAWTSGTCSSRVVRGGSWNDGPGVLRAALRASNTTEHRNDDVGFRVARTLTP